MGPLGVIPDGLSLAVVAMIVALVIPLLPVVGFGSYKIDYNGTFYCIYPGDITPDENQYDFYFTVLFLAVGLVMVMFILICNTITISKIMNIRYRARTIMNLRPKQVKGHSSRDRTTVTSSRSNLQVQDTRCNSRHLCARGRRRRKQKPEEVEIFVSRQVLIGSVVFTVSWLPFYVRSKSDIA